MEACCALFKIPPNLQLIVCRKVPEADWELKTLTLDMRSYSLNGWDIYHLNEWSIYHLIGWGMYDLNGWGS